jgi:hypothetical protein
VGARQRAWTADWQQGIWRTLAHATQEAACESSERARAALQAGQAATGRAGSQECADARLLRIFTGGVSVSVN